MRRAPLFGLLAAAAAWASPAFAQQQPDARIGERLARQWCASCHLVAADQRAPAPDTAPPFASIAARPSATPGALRTIIQMPYPRMPQIALTRDEVEHVIAYIVSLKR
ncbi:MAG: c-type cytochrome [Alphaproteobacteria bacterium]